MKFRRATANDFEQLAKLRWDFRMEGGDEPAAAAKEEFIDACIAFLKRGLQSGIYVYWVAETAGIIVSQIFVYRVELVPRPCKLADQFGYVTNDYTMPEYRNQGIGSELMKNVIDWATSEDMELLICYPSEAAVSFYERAGFSNENDVMELKLRDYFSPDWITDRS